MTELPDVIEICQRVLNLGQRCGQRIYRPADGHAYCYACGSTSDGVIYWKHHSDLMRGAIMDVRAATLETLELERGSIQHWLAERLAANAPDEHAFWSAFADALISQIEHDES